MGRRRDGGIEGDQLAAERVAKKYEIMLRRGWGEAGGGMGCNKHSILLRQRMI